MRLVGECHRVECVLGGLRDGLAARSMTNCSREGRKNLVGLYDRGRTVAHCEDALGEEQGRTVRAQWDDSFETALHSLMS